MSAPIVNLDNCPPELVPALHTALVTAGLVPGDNLGVLPDVVVVWLKTGQETAQTKAIRQAFAPDLPAILAISDFVPENYATVQISDADAYLDCDDPDHIAKVCASLAWSRQRFLQTNPLTGLPGNVALAAEIQRRLPHRSELAVLAFDLDAFKGYNDRYGYARGDDLLRWFAALLRQCLAIARPGWMLGHLGGDDFLALVHPAESPVLAETIITRFDTEAPGFYDPGDRAAGGITTRSRTGETIWSPLVSLTIAQVTNEAEDITHTGQVAAILGELKGYGKSLPGSRYVPDRRRNH